MASHPSPFNRQRQSNKTLDPNSDTAKFLYTILKQLDLKNVDWNEVARSLDITNGHAARMRWSRFRAQIEGLDNSYSRKSTKKTDDNKRRMEKEINKKRNDPFLGGYGYDAMPAKRMKMDESDNMKGEDTIHVDSESSDELLNTIKNEMKKTNVFNGALVHHPTVSTVSMPPPSSYYNDTNQYPLPVNIPSQRSSVTPNQYLERVHSSSASTAQQQWQQQQQQQQQQFNGSGYGYNTYHPMPAATPFSTGPNMYANQYPYSSTYGSQRPQRYDYGQQASRMQFQAQNAYAADSFYTTAEQPMQRSSFPVTVTAQPQGSSLTQLRSVNTAQPVSNQPLSQAPATSKSTASEQFRSQVLNQALQESYPWPHSDAAISFLLAEMEETSDAQNGDKVVKEEVVEDTIEAGPGATGETSLAAMDGEKVEIGVKTGEEAAIKVEPGL